ncbi:MAG: hypothetical protein IKF07_02760 [Eubacterium sp.]|nr:hypothetical protein [Eubacterium sp.]
MNTLYLHIGTQKTATTTLQHFLTENDEVLKTKGYTYPMFPEIFYPYWDNTRNGLFLGHPYFNKHNVRNREKEKDFYNKGMARLHEIFRSYPNVILSEERLWLELFYDKAALMKQLIDDGREYGYQIKLIVYLRRQDVFAESYWNQQIKSTITETRDVAQFIDEFEHINYYYVLKVITDVAGVENLDVVRFDDAVKGDGIIADFMRRIGLELTDEYTITQEATNSRLSGNTAEIKRIINQMDDLLIGDQIYLKDRVNMVSDLSSKKYKCSTLSEEERAAFMERFKKGNDLAAELYIHDGKPLFSEDYSCPPKWEKDNPEYLDDVILTSAAGDILLYRRVKAAEYTIEKLEKRIEKLESALEKQTRRIDHMRHPMKALIGKVKK